MLIAENNKNKEKKWPGFNMHRTSSLTIDTVKERAK